MIAECFCKIDYSGQPYKRSYNAWKITFMPILQL